MPFAAAKAPHTHFVCLDSRAEMPDLRQPGGKSIWFGCVQISNHKGVWAHTDARAAQTAWKRSEPFLLPILHTWVCSWLCPRGQCQPEGCGPQGQEGDNCRELPSPVPMAPGLGCCCSHTSHPHSCSCIPVGWTSPGRIPSLSNGRKGEKSEGQE